MIYDCIIIGGGPAGLTAALFLARYCRRAITFHHNAPRNQYAHGIHGLIGSDSIPPAQLLQQGRAEVARYGGIVHEALVTGVEKNTDGHFRVTATPDGLQQAFLAQRLLIASGLRDVAPDVPGFLECYGRTVHHCPDCDGYEIIGKRIAVLSSGPRAAPFVVKLLNWTQRITLITHGPAQIGDEHRAALTRMSVPIVERRVVALEGDLAEGRVRRVRLEGGDAAECDAVFFNFGTVHHSAFYKMLGCRLDEKQELWVGEDQQCSTPGVYAAGDVTGRSQLVVVAAAEGAMAAIQIHQSLLKAEYRV